MEKKILAILIVGTLLLFPFVAAGHQEELEEEDELSCDSFSKKKFDDCEYILDSDLDQEDKEELLEILEEQSYNYKDNPQQEIFEFVENSHIDRRNLDYSRLWLAWNITVFGFINYFAFSVLTKPSILAKCQNVDY